MGNSLITIIVRKLQWMVEQYNEAGIFHSALEPFFTISENSFVISISNFFSEIPIETLINLSYVVFLMCCFSLKYFLKKILKKF